MELHRHLGHISVTSTRKLVQSRAIKGIKLDPNAPETDCEACIFAHAMCLPILYTSHISARQPKALGIRSTLMSGGPHPSQLQRVCATLSPSQMTQLASQSSTCSRLKTRSSSSTSSLRHGQSHSSTAVASRYCLPTTGVRTLARLSTSTLWQRAQHGSSPPMTHCS